MSTVLVVDDKEMLRDSVGATLQRAGFSVVEVSGSKPGALARFDGTDLFAPTLPGGAAAKLFSVAGEEELLELGWRTHEMASQAAVEGTRWRP